MMKYRNTSEVVCLIFLALRLIVLSAVMTHGTGVSPLYHFALSDGTTLSAQSRCKFCCPPNPDIQPFIMGIHTIDRCSLQQTAVLVLLHVGKIKS